MKKLFILGIIVISHVSYSQIGIRTANPLGIFHIDGKGNTPAESPTSLQLADDFIITEEGKALMGQTSVNSSNGNAKLIINNGNNIGAIQIQDGSQKFGRVLVSDNNGVAAWQDLYTGTPIKGTLTWTPNTAIGNTNWNSIGYLSVPPGSYLIYYKVHLLAERLPNSSLNIRSFRTFVSTNFLTNYSGGQTISPLQGSQNFVSSKGIDLQSYIIFFYSNTGNSNVTLYFNLQSDAREIARSSFEENTPLFGVPWSENYYYAVPIIKGSGYSE